MKELTDLITAIGPAAVALATLITLIVNTVQNMRIKKEIKATKEIVTTTHEITNHRMDELKAVLISENLMKGEKAGHAQGVSDEADRQQKESDAYDLGKQVGKDRQIASDKNKHG